MPSSVIQDFAYDPDARELSIWFTSGRIYVYFAVPEEVFSDLSGAFSKGSYFNRRIRDNYQCREVTPS